MVVSFVIEIASGSQDFVHLLAFYSKAEANLVQILELLIPEEEVDR